MDTTFRQILDALSDQAFMLLPFAALLGMATVAAIYRRPAVGAALILFAAPLEGFLMVGGNSIVKLATILCVLVFAARILLVTRGFRIDSVAVALLAFVAWTYASLIWSPREGFGLSHWISFALSTLLYLVLINFVASKGDLRLMIWGHVIGGTILALLLISEEVAQEFQRKSEVAGLGLNLAARLTALNALLSIFLFQSEPAKIKKFVVIPAIFVSLIASIVSLSRGAWVSLLLALAAFGAVYLVNRGSKFKPSYLVVGFVVVFATVSILNSFVLDEHGAEKLATRFDQGITLQDDAGGRLDIWQVGLTMFADAPLQGHGYGSFAYYYNFYAGTGSLGVPSPAESKAAHNSFVGVLVQFGVVGFTLFLAVAFSAFRKTWAIWRSGPRNNATLAWVAALAVFLVAANFVDYAIDRKYLWYVLGLITLIALYGGAEEKASTPEVATAPARQAARLRLQGSRANR